MNGTINVAFAGNPNCGKTTLFNALTGSNLKVANWPGVTVEKKEGFVEYNNRKYKMVDLPGTYSLTSYSMEEIVARNYIMQQEVDVIINIVDASALERNLYLTLQLIELGKPVIMALNMMDIVEQRGLEIDMHRLPEMLGIPVIPVCARKRSGLKALMHAVEHHRSATFDRLEHHHSPGSHKHSHHEEFPLVYSDEIEDKIDAVTDRLFHNYPDLNNYRWHSIKLLESDNEIISKYPLKLDDIMKRSYESDIINQKYEFIEEIIHDVLYNKAEKVVITDKVDAVLTHKIWGLPLFFLIMALVFFLTFTIGDFLKGFFEIGLKAFSDSTQNYFIFIGMGKVITSLVVDGIIAGVGGILTFLPNIFILFLALAFLEDSGYMARVAYVMDGIMSKIGLSGKAFIPMILGFGCTVPAIMAARTLENNHDRLRTILVTPFISCSARLPIYVLFSQLFFGSKAMLAAYSMYVIGVAVAILVAFVISKISTNVTNTLLIELPEYKFPSLRTVFIYVWSKVKDYLTKAGTTIFIASIVLWLLLNFSKSGMVTDMSQSFAAAAGKFLVPVMAPAGLGYWQIVVALISGIAAKEVVVSSMSVLYGISNIASQTGMSSLTGQLLSQGFTAVNAYSLMLFSLLYIPCIATIAIIRKETSVKWMLVSIGLQLSTAWLISAAFFQIASIIAA